MSLDSIINGARLLFAPPCPACNDGKLLPYINPADPMDSVHWGVKCTHCYTVYNYASKNVLAAQGSDMFMRMNKDPQQTKHQFRIELLMHCAKHAVPLVPFLPDEKVRKLRAKLMLEECLEAVHNLGFDVKIGDNNWKCQSCGARFAEYVNGCPKCNKGSVHDEPDLETVQMDNLEFIPNGHENLVGIADGCADTSVVTIGTLSACGIKDNPLLEEVDGNNLGKFGPEAIANGAGYNADGKWVKAKNHPKPDIEGVLRKQGM
jgi:hypothetical protein